MHGTDITPKTAACRASVFTLLELLLAVALMVLMITMLAGAGNAITSSWQRIGTRRKQFAEILKLDRALDTMLSNIVPFQWPDAGGRKQGIFAGTDKEIRFVCQHELNNLKDGALRFVRMRVDDGRLMAAYQERPLLDPEYPENIRRTVLAEGVDRIELRYADWSPEQGLFWVEEWNQEDRERLSAPLGVFLRVIWKDGRWESWLRRTAGSALHERWGDWQPDKRF